VYGVAVTALAPSFATATATHIGPLTGSSPALYYGFVTFTGVAITTTSTTIAQFDIIDLNGDHLIVDCPVETSLAATPSEIAFSSAGAAVQTTTISGGTVPYTAVSSDTSIATVSVASPVITVTPVAPGSCYITVTDTYSGYTTGGKLLGFADDITLIIPVSVGGTGATSGQLWPIWGN